MTQLALKNAPGISNRDMQSRWVAQQRSQNPQKNRICLYRVQVNIIYLNFHVAHTFFFKFMQKYELSSERYVPVNISYSNSSIYSERNYTSLQRKYDRSNYKDPCSTKSVGIVGFIIAMIF